MPTTSAAWGPWAAMRTCDPVILRLSVGPRAVVDGHQRFVAFRQQRAQCARPAERLVARHWNNLTGVGVVRGDDDQGVGVVLRELEAHADRSIERNGLADLLTGVLDVVLLVDRRAFNLQEETALIPATSPSSSSSRSIAFEVMAASDGSLAGRWFSSQVCPPGSRCQETASLAVRSTRATCCRR